MIPESGITIVDEALIPQARICLRSDGIMHVHFSKDVTFDVALQQQMRKIYDRMTTGKKTKFIFSAEEGFVFTREARENAPLLQKQSPIQCFALVINSLAYRIVANFYIKVMKPDGNYKVVNSINEAVSWLNSLKV